MKKLLSLALALVLCMSLATTAFADLIETIDPGETAANTNDHSIFATTVTTPAGTVYSIDIAWGQMSFTYTTIKGVWDPDTLTYSDDRGSWAAGYGTSDYVTVHNYSNASVVATLDAVVLEDFRETITATVSNHTAGQNTGAQFGDDGVATLASADNTLDDGKATATLCNFGVTLSGEPATDLTSTIIGTLIVTITAPVAP